MPGKPATAAVAPDGTFVLSTYEPEDGAAVGRHHVLYTPPEGAGDVDEENSTVVEEGSAEEARLNAERKKKAAEARKNRCVLEGEKIVEVKAGEENDFTIELTPAAEARGEE
jgi:hypothetical protein